jgi:hypothetical protein
MLYGEILAELGLLSKGEGARRRLALYSSSLIFW